MALRYTALQGSLLWLSLEHVYHYGPVKVTPDMPLFCQMSLQFAGGQETDQCTSSRVVHWISVCIIFHL